MLKGMAAMVALLLHQPFGHFDPTWPQGDDSSEDELDDASKVAAATFATVSAWSVLFFIPAVLCPSCTGVWICEKLTYVLLCTAPVPRRWPRV